MTSKEKITTLLDDTYTQRQDFFHAFKEAQNNGHSETAEYLEKLELICTARIDVLEDVLNMLEQD